MSTHHALDTTTIGNQYVASTTSLISTKTEPCVQNGHIAMSAHRLRICLSIIGWSEREFARRTGEHRTTVTRWLNDAASVPANVAAWVERLAAAHQDNPFPRRNSAILAGELVS